jgi:hypothetical protein
MLRKLLRIFVASVIGAGIGTVVGLALKAIGFFPLRGLS